MVNIYLFPGLIFEYLYWCFSNYSNLWNFSCWQT